MLLFAEPVFVIRALAIHKTLITNTLKSRGSVGFSSHAPLQVVPFEGCDPKP